MWSTRWSASEFISVGIPFRLSPINVSWREIDAPNDSKSDNCVKPIYRLPCQKIFNTKIILATNYFIVGGFEPLKVRIATNENWRDMALFSQNYSNVKCIISTTTIFTEDLEFGMTPMGELGE